MSKTRKQLTILQRMARARVVLKGIDRDMWRVFSIGLMGLNEVKARECWLALEEVREECRRARRIISEYRSVHARRKMDWDKIRYLHVPITPTTWEQLQAISRASGVQPIDTARKLLREAIHKGKTLGLSQKC